MASSSEEAPPTPEDLLSDELHRLSFTSATTSTTTNTTTPTDIHRSTSSGSSSTTTTWTSSSKPQYSTASSDPCWDSLRRLRSSPSNGGSAPLSFSDLQFLHRLGSGDIGSVYLAELRNSPDCAFFAAKIMDKKELESRNKEGRARTEREILQLLDHPFLPTLYACLESTRWFCLLTDFCPGGDLHVLRQRQPGKRFHESAVRDCCDTHLDAGVCGSRYGGGRVRLMMCGHRRRDVGPLHRERRVGHVRAVGRCGGLSDNTWFGACLEQLGHSIQK